MYGRHCGCSDSALATSVCVFCFPSSEAKLADLGRGGYSPEAVTEEVLIDTSLKASSLVLALRSFADVDVAVVMLGC